MHNVNFLPVFCYIQFLIHQQTILWLVS